MPAIYSFADCGSTQSAKKPLKNSHPKAAIVKGLINQLMTSVNANPLGLLPTSLMDEKSIWIIMGYTINQINTATTIFTWAYSKLATNAKNEGIILPKITPAMMLMPTHTDK